MYRDRWRIKDLVFGARRAGGNCHRTANLSTFNVTVTLFRIFELLPPLINASV
jgi:hypothetical protein